MIDASTAPYAALLLRVGLGLLFLAHADLQIRVYGLPTEVSIMEFSGDKVSHETQYFADPFTPPAWRSQWVEPMG